MAVAALRHQRSMPGAYGYTLVCNRFDEFAVTMPIGGFGVAIAELCRDNSLLNAARPRRARTVLFQFRRSMIT